MTHFRLRPPFLTMVVPGRAAIAGVLAAVAMAVSPQAQAERADRLKPLNIEADAGRYDDQKQFGVFTGNVVMSKGTLVMRAAQIEVRQLPDGFHTGVALGGNGRLATFSQKRDGVDETIEGEAERIEYDARSDTVRLINRATIRRLRAGVAADETAGSLITYNNQTEVFTVSGGPNAVSPSNPTGRVRTVITPREGTAAADEAATQGAGRPPAAPDPNLATPPAAPTATPLQPSSGLGDRR